MVSNKNRFCVIDPELNSAGQSVAAAFQLPEPLKGHLEIGNNRHAKHTTARRRRISRSSCKLCCANAPAEDSAGQAFIGYMDESRHAPRPYAGTRPPKNGISARLSVWGRCEVNIISAPA
jgi:hypothetical protein